MSSHPQSLLLPVLLSVGLLLAARSSAAGEALATPPTDQGYIGIGSQNVTQEFARERKLPDNKGLLITNVTPQSPAAAAGLKEGDILIEFDGKGVADDVSFGATIRQLPPGKQLAVKFVRDGQIGTTTVTVGETPPAIAYLRRGYDRSNNGDLPGAIADYTEAIRLEPKDARWYFSRGFAKARSGDGNGAIADYTEAIRLDPRYVLAYVNRGLAEAHNGDRDGAIADHTEAIRLDPKNAEVYFYRGLARQNKGDLDGTIADYTEAVRLNPAYALAYVNRGLAKAYSGNRDGAIADYTEAIRVDSKYVLAYLNRGIAKANNGDREGAMADFTEAIRLEPKNAEAYFYRGLARQNKGDFDGAAADYTEAIGLDPTNPDSYINRGLSKTNSVSKKGGRKLGRSEAAAAQKCSAEAKADYQEAIRRYTERIARYPNNFDAYTNRATAKDQLGDQGGAAQDRTEAARVKEQVALTRFREETARASLSDLLASSDKTESQARERNRSIIAAKNQQLPALLRERKTDELSAFVVKIEQTILDLNHECELAKDQAQQSVASGDAPRDNAGVARQRGLPDAVARARGLPMPVASTPARGIEELRGLAISYRERIELLKPILTALKEEIANRNR